MNILARKPLLSLAFPLPVQVPTGPSLLVQAMEERLLNTVFQPIVTLDAVGNGLGPELVDAWEVTSQAAD